MEPTTRCEYVDTFINMRKMYMTFEARKKGEIFVSTIYIFIETDIGFRNIQVSFVLLF